MSKKEREEEKKIFPGGRRGGPSFIDDSRKEGGTGWEEEGVHSNFSATAVKFQKDSLLASGRPREST